jgi:crotonobetainyl-CoA:carnitine CoA-transferase CaiB-like acyl-CoA transferase
METVADIALSRQRKEQRTAFRFEIISAALLALATIASAWSVYQATRWSGVQAFRYSEADAARVQASETADFADTLITIDVVSFAQYVEALGQGNPDLATFFLQRSREELRIAINAWLATKPLENPEAPLNPFGMPEYHLAAADEAAGQRQLAQGKTEEAKDATHHADNYILLTVLFASSLFFGGLASIFDTRLVKLFSLIMGIALLIITAGLMVTFPIH